MKPLNVAIIGLGTVGSGVARVLLEQPERIERRCGRPVVLKRVVVRDVAKPRDVKLPDGVLTDEIQTVIDDPEIDVALELVGGIDPVRDYLERLLRAGKDVVTANKALIYEHGGELFPIARELGRVIAFEASVCGGVPVIAAIGQALAGNQIRSIEAILNGTCNFILTEMLDGNCDYDDVVARAQQMGYAEADPAMDVEGTDAAHKLTILTQLAFGAKVSIDDFTVRGIDTLELADLRYADELGYAVKLLGVCKQRGNELEMHVQPTLLRKHRPLAGISGVYNQLAVEADVVGRVWLSGMGAGQMATSSAVLADLVDVAVGRAALTFSKLDLWRTDSPLTVKQPTDVEARFYLRFNVEDRPHVFADIADILGRNGISLASIIQHEAPELEETEDAEFPTVPVVVMTHRTTEGRLRAAEAELDQLKSLRQPLVRMPVSDASQ